MLFLGVVAVVIAAFAAALVACIKIATLVVAVEAFDAGVASNAFVVVDVVVFVVDWALAVPVDF
jgi:hypothetical protein